MKEVCRETLQQAYLYLDGERLSEDERRQIQEHLEACAPCYERYGLEEEVHKLLGRLRGSGPCCPDRLKDKIVNLLQTS